MSGQGYVISDGGEESLVEDFKAQEAKGRQIVASEAEVFSAATRNSLFGVIVRDLYGYIMNVNDEVLKMYGTYDKSEFVGKNVLNFIIKSDKERAIADCMKILISDHGMIGKYQALTKIGEEISVEVTIELIRDENGEKIGFVDTIRNLSIAEKEEMKKEK